MAPQRKSSAWVQLRHTWGSRFSCSPWYSGVLRAGDRSRSDGTGGLLRFIGPRKKCCGVFGTELENLFDLVGWFLTILDLHGYSPILELVAAVGREFHKKAAVVGILFGLNKTVRIRRIRRGRVVKSRTRNANRDGLDWRCRFPHRKHACACPGSSHEDPAPTNCPRFHS